MNKTQKIRYFLIIVCAIVTLFFIIDRNYNAIISALAGLILFLGSRSKNKINIALIALRKEDHLKAEQSLAEINNPSTLPSHERARWYYAKGLISTQRQEWSDAINWYKKAIKHQLEKPKDAITAYLNMSISSINLMDIKEAKAYFEAAKKLAKNGEMQKEIAWVNDQISSAS